MMNLTILMITLAIYQNKPNKRWLLFPIGVVTLHTCTLPGEIARTNTNPSLSDGPTARAVSHTYYFHHI